MEDRLLPINALLGLLRPHDLGPPALARAGFELAGLEIPAGAPGSSVVVDMLLFHSSTNHLVPVEAKAGANVDAAQAIRYGNLRALDLVRSAYLTLPTRTPPTVECVYLCLAEHGDRIRLGLAKAGLECPIILVSHDSVGLDDVASPSSQLAGVFATGPIPLTGPPPRLIPFDGASRLEVIKPHVLAVLVEAMSQRLTELTLSSVAERATWHYGLYGRRAQQQIRRKVSDAVTEIVVAEPANFAYVPGNQTRDGLVKILRTPEDNHPQGRTQAYQAVGRHGIMRKGGKAGPWHPGQLDLFAVLDEGDNERGDRPEPGEEGAPR